MNIHSDEYWFNMDSIQEQLIQARRRQILNAAIEVFADKGFHRATIKDIAREAGIADGTIYNYFGNKTDLLLGILDQMNATEEREEQLSAVAEAPDLRGAFAASLRQRLADLLPYQRVLQAVLPEILVNDDLRARYYQQVIAPTTALAEGYFQQLAESGQVRALDVPVVVRVISGATLGLLLLRMLGDERLQGDWNNLPDTITTMLLDGLLPG
jgi:TetR/AcrR family fatty acid metabolism transcriptional regulator